MGAMRKLRRDRLRRKLAKMGATKVNKRMSTYWRDYNAGRKI